MKTGAPKNPCTYPDAFTLVEVVIALGVISFAILALVGLLPSGLNVLRDSMGQSRQAQILRTVAGRAEVSRFNALATNGLYFDYDGLPVTNAKDSVYTVSIETAPPVYPGSGNSTTLTNGLTSLRVKIIWKPSSSAAGRTNQYSLQVANDGKTNY